MKNQICIRKALFALFSMFSFILASFAILGPGLSMSAQAGRVHRGEATVERRADGMAMQLAQGELRLQIISASVVRGTFSEIPIRWNDTTSTLTIGTHTGSFPGMLRTRTLQVVLISGRHPAGFAFSPDLQRSVTYNGSEIRLKL